MGSNVSKAPTPDDIDDGKRGYGMISVLCIDRHSNYKKIAGLDLWDRNRDAYNYRGTNPVIAHPPCSQWSGLRAFSRINQKEKNLAWFCLMMVKQNGGIFEHPAGSAFWEIAGIVPTISVDQSWWGYPCRKTTWLYFNGIKPLSHPIMGFVSKSISGKYLPEIRKKDRALMPLSFCFYLVNCINQPQNEKANQ